MKVIKLTVAKEDEKSSEVGMLRGLLENAPAQGFTMDQVRKSVKAIDVIDKAKEKVEEGMISCEFEDAIVAHMKECVSKAKFIRATKIIADFVDKIDKW